MLPLMMRGVGRIRRRGERDAMGAEEEGNGPGARKAGRGF